jgi:hypothetical protein
MRFQITMNMPSRSGNQVHQIIGEHRAESLEEFIDAFEGVDFLIVEEIYRDNEAGNKSAGFYKVGQVAINPMYVGKIKVLQL